ncbi:MAG: ribonuclease III [Phycisphaerae bacterium]|nr:ribonuclease III [Phycisphaerae bacterium]
MGNLDVNTLNGVSPSDALERCEEAIGYKFKDQQLLRAALTHASSANSRVESNERLEFLGDAVLALIVCDELYTQFPEALEGDLTKVKSAVVSRRICAHLSKAAGLEDLIFLGKGMIGRSGLPTSLLAAVFESLIAAVYLDSDFETVKSLVLRLIRPVIDEVTKSKMHQNYKSQLQQYAQREMEVTPIYEVLDEKGPDHSKCFEICVRLSDRRFDSAWGTSKKEAEQYAAEKALDALGLLDKSPHPAN